MPQHLSFLETELSGLSIPHEISTDPQRGMPSVSVGIPMTAGRHGFQPELGLGANGSGKNSAFGIGWDLSGVNPVGINMENGYPRYDGKEGYAFGGQALVPSLEMVGGAYLQRVDGNAQYQVFHYRTKVDPTYVRIEKWVDRATNQIHWRVRQRNNQVIILGAAADGSSQIRDPNHPDRVFQWLPEVSFDNLGNVIRFEYKAEDLDNVDRTTSYESTRPGDLPEYPQRYLKRIRYGNSLPQNPEEPEPAGQSWMFEVVLDYGEHLADPATAANEANLWPSRLDPFSSYAAGFEIRTYRLCRRILMFHRFAELGPGLTLVSSMDLNFEEAPDQDSRLTSVSMTGYLRTLGTNNYTQRSLPPLTFEYSGTTLEQSFSTPPVETLENIPFGIGRGNYRWIDLYGEGLPGILYESNFGWFFKRNLGNGRLGPQKQVVSQPNAPFGGYSLSDLNSDGNQDLVTLFGRTAGYYEFDRATEGWKPFRPFERAPQIGGVGKNTQMLDLTGDGNPDIVNISQGRISWFPSLGKEGYGEPVEISRAVSNGVSRAPVMGNDSMLDHFFADMTGDGLPDQVFIRNGRVEYWPNLGHGRFGNGIVMENAPVFDHEFKFDAARLRFTDLLGTGGSDIIYLGRGEISYWINLGGNKFLDGVTLKGVPYFDQFGNVDIMNFLGDGTPCLVWSAGMSSGGADPIQYMRLNVGIQPNLITSVSDSMGQETHFHYGHSSQHYLRDQAEGRPWITKIPHHAPVVDRMEMVDLIGNTNLQNLYRYHDGYFDSHKQQFIGFSQVDQYDSESYSGDIELPPAQFTHPVCIRTWIHNGATAPGTDRAEQYYVNAPQHGPHYTFEDLSGLGPEEYRIGVAALSGQVIRKETFAIDVQGNREAHPFEVTENHFLIRRLQPGTQEHEPVFGAFAVEGLEYAFEGIPDNPRVTHSFVLEIDDYGNPLLSARVAYPSTDSGAYLEQQSLYLQVSQAEKQSFDTLERYEPDINVEERDFEINEVNPLPGDRFFHRSNLYNQVLPLLAAPITFADPFAGGAEAKLWRWTQHFYWNNNQDAALALGDLGDHSLIHHSETACFHDPWLANVLGVRHDPGRAAAEGYALRDGYWWKSGIETRFLDRNGFYLPRTEISPGENQLEITYDPYFLAVVSQEDQLQNATTALIDYHFAAPFEIRDMNQNISEVRYDPLGMIVLSGMRGTIRDDTNTLRETGMAPLATWVDPGPATLQDVIINPEAFVQDAFMYYHYDLYRWTNEGLPPGAIQISRENWLNDGNGNVNGVSSVQVIVSYLDGFGRALQNKVLVDSGLAFYRNAADELVLQAGEPVEAFSNIRWQVSGHIVYNNKQAAVLEYESYFSSTAEYESEEVLRSYGNTTINFYDVLGRNVESQSPNGTIARTEFEPWQSRAYDFNDTVIGSQYELERLAIADANHPERIALAKSQTHNNTPVTSQLDPRGNTFLNEEVQAGGVPRQVRSRYDFMGDPIETIDARGITSNRLTRDMTGRVFAEESTDSGPRWQFLNLFDQPTHSWDGRGVVVEYVYDAMGRISSYLVSGALGMNHRTQRFVYGDSLPMAASTERNARGQLIEHYDSSGRLEIGRYDLSGQALVESRRMVTDYRNIPNWEIPAAVGLDPEIYTTRTEYDALSRMLASQLPDGTTRSYQYSANGTVRQVRVTTQDGQLVDLPILEDTRYNSRGQIVGLTLGNGMVRNFEYDARSYRVSRMAAYMPGPGGAPGRQYQNLRVYYDAFGNIVRALDLVQDGADAALAGVAISAVREFTYDSFYQLRSATGRVHQATQPNDYAHAPNAPGFIKGTRHIGLNNGAAVRRYQRDYAYDEEGNLERMDHRTFGLGPEADTVWNRQYWVSPTSNRSLPDTDLNGVPIPGRETRFDGNGNLNYLPHLRRFEWDYKNQLSRAVIIERANDVDDAEYYVYSADNRRTRKVSERLVAGQLEVTEKIYLDGCEIKRRSLGGIPQLERTTSQLTDGSQRIALLHQWTRDTLGRETVDINQKRIHYQLTDQTNSNNLEVNQAGDVISYEEYFPFGGSAFIAGNNLRDIRLKEYRYSGKERDDTTGLYYYGYRYYASWLGRWISPDPIGPEDGLNLYRFVHNNPLNLQDPDGLQSTEPPPEPDPPAEDESPAPAGFSVRIRHTNGQIELHRFDTAEGARAFAREYLREHPQTIVRDSIGAQQASEPAPTDGDEEELAPGYYSMGGEGSNPSDPDSPANTPGSGASEIPGASGVGAETGTGTPGAQGNGTTPGAGGPNGTGSGTGVPGGNGLGGNGNGGNGNGNGNGRGTGGRGRGGTGTGGRPSQQLGNPQAHPRGVAGGTGTPEGFDPDSYDPNRPPNPNGTIDPSAATGVESSGGQAGHPDGDPNGSPTGTSLTGAPEQELEWWQTALIIAAVVVVSIVVTIVTAGAATAFIAAAYGTAAASSLGAVVAIGAVSGFAAGMASDLTSQSLNLAFRGRDVLSNLDMGQAFEAGVVGGIVGAFTAGTGHLISSAARGAFTSSASAFMQGSTTATQRGVLGAARAFNNSAAVRAGVRGLRGAVLGGTGGSLGEATTQLIHNGSITDGGAILSAGVQGMAMGAAMDSTIGAAGDRLRARANAAPMENPVAPRPVNPNNPGTRSNPAAYAAADTVPPPGQAASQSRVRPVPFQGRGRVEQVRAGPSGSGIADDVLIEGAGRSRRVHAVSMEMRQSHLDVRGTGTNSGSRGAAQAHHNSNMNGNQGNVFQAGHGRASANGGRGIINQTFAQWGHVNMGEFNQFGIRLNQLLRTIGPNDRIFASIQPRFVAGASGGHARQVVFLLHLEGRTIVRAIFNNHPGRSFANGAQVRYY